MKAAATTINDVLLLAQQKLDEINRENIGLSSTAFGRRGHRRKGIITSHLLSTLLYCSILSYKLEDVKTMLEEEDPETYEEWRCLFETMHSPIFHAQERLLQNQRVKRTFSRKRRYKAEAQRLQEELTNASNGLSNLQLLSNETNNQMIKAINTLHEERASLVLEGGDKQRRIEELNEQFSGLRIEIVQKDAMLRTLESELDNLRQILKERNLSIAALNEESSHHKHDAAVAKEAANHSRLTLDDVRARLEASNGRLADFQVASESTMTKLKQELTEARSSNTILSAKVETTNRLLDATKQHFEESKKVIVEKSATYDDIKNYVDDLKTVFQSGMSQMTHASDKAAGSLELRVDQLHRAFSIFECENNNAPKELLALRHQMKDLGQLHQLDTLRHETSNVQQRSDDIFCELRQCTTSQQQSTRDNLAVGLVENITSQAISRLGGVDH